MPGHTNVKVTNYKVPGTWDWDNQDKEADKLDSNTCMVLVNAIYFKGDWAAKFDPKLTNDKVFNVSSFNTVMVPMI